MLNLAELLSMIAWALVQWGVGGLAVTASFNDLPSGTLARAQSYEFNSCHIEYDRRYWDLEPWQFIRRDIVLHEAGHCAGYDGAWGDDAHSANPNSIMWPDATGLEFRRILPEDRAFVRERWFRWMARTGQAYGGVKVVPVPGLAAD